MKRPIPAPPRPRHIDLIADLNDAIRACETASRENRPLEEKRRARERMHAAGRALGEFRAALQREREGATR